MELGVPLYKWLRQCGALANERPAGKSQSGYRVRLGPRNATLVANGVALLRVLRTRLGETLEEEELERGSTRTALHVNWNVLGQALKRAGIQLDDDMKKLIVAGDNEVTISVYVDLQRRLGTGREHRRGPRPRPEGPSDRAVRNGYAREHHELFQHRRKQDAQNTRSEVLLPRAPGDRRRGRTSESMASAVGSTLSTEAPNLAGFAPPTTRSTTDRVLDAMVASASGPDQRAQIAIPTEILRRLDSGDVMPDAGTAGSAEEMLAIAVMTQLHVTAHKAAALLGAAQPAMAQLLVRGAHGSYVMVRALLREVHAQTRRLGQLLAGLHESRAMAVLCALRPSLASRDALTVRLGARIIGRLAVDLAEGGATELLWEWFSTTGALAAISASLRRHPSAKRALLPLVDLCCRTRLAALFSAPILSRAIPDANSQLLFALDALALLSASEATRTALLHGGALSILLQLGLRHAAASATASSTMLEDAVSTPGGSSADFFANEVRAVETLSLRLAALQLLVELWLAFPEQLEAQDGTSRAVLALLKRALREPRLEVAASAAGLLFEMLEKFTTEHNAHAPLVYKTLVFALLESHANAALRELLQANLSDSLVALPHVPVGVLIEPLTKQVSLRGYNNVDFDFFLVLARHARLGLRHAVLLLDLLGKICLNDPIFGRVASVPLLAIVSRFHEQPALLEYLDRFTRVSFEVLLNLESKPPHNRFQPSHGPSANEGDESSFIRTTLILETFGKMLAMQLESVAARIIPHARVAASQYTEATGERHAGLAALLATSARGGVSAFDEGSTIDNGDDSAPEVDILFTRRPPSQQGFAVSAANGGGGGADVEIHTGRSAASLGMHARNSFYPVGLTTTSPLMPQGVTKAISVVLEYSSKVAERTQLLPKLWISVLKNGGVQYGVRPSARVTIVVRSRSHESRKQTRSDSQRKRRGRTSSTLASLAPHELQSKQPSGSQCVSVSGGDVALLRRIFELIDVDGSGSLGKVELLAAFQSHPSVRGLLATAASPTLMSLLDPSEYEQALMRAKTENYGRMSWKEFRAFVLLKMQKRGMRNIQPLERERLNHVKVAVEDGDTKWSFQGDDQPSRSPEVVAAAPGVRKDEDRRAALQLFGAWRRPLRSTYRRFARAQVNMSRAADSFDDLRRNADSLSIVEWSAFLRFARLQPTYLNSVASLALFHRATAKRKQELQFNEFVACLRAIALSPAFDRGTTAPLSDETQRATALVAHLYAATLKHAPDRKRRLTAEQKKVQLAREFEACQQEAHLELLGSQLSQFAVDQLGVPIKAQEERVFSIPEKLQTASISKRRGVLREAHGVVLSLLDDLLVSAFGAEARLLLPVVKVCIPQKRKAYTSAAEAAKAASAAEASRRPHQPSGNRPTVSNRLYPAGAIRERRRRILKARPKQSKVVFGMHYVEATTKDPQRRRRRQPRSEQDDDNGEQENLDAENPLPTRVQKYIAKAALPIVRVDKLEVRKAAEAEERQKLKKQKDVSRRQRQRHLEKKMLELGEAREEKERLKLEEDRRAVEVKTMAEAKQQERLRKRHAQQKRKIERYRAKMAKVESSKKNEDMGTKNALDAKRKQDWAQRHKKNVARLRKIQADRASKIEQDRLKQNKADRYRARKRQQMTKRAIERYENASEASDEEGTGGKNPAVAAVSEEKKKGLKSEEKTKGLSIDTTTTKSSRRASMTSISGDLTPALEPSDDTVHLGAGIEGDDAESVILEPMETSRSELAVKPMGPLPRLEGTDEDMGPPLKVSEEEEGEEDKNGMSEGNESPHDGQRDETNDTGLGEVDGQNESGNGNDEGEDGTQDEAHQSLDSANPERNQSEESGTEERGVDPEAAREESTDDINE